MRRLLLFVATSLFLSFNGAGAPAFAQAGPSYTEMSFTTQTAVPYASDRLAKASSQASQLDAADRGPHRSFFEFVGTILLLSAAGLVMAMASVGMREVWARHPIRYPVDEPL